MQSDIHEWWIVYLLFYFMSHNSDLRYKSHESCKCYCLIYLVNAFRYSSRFNSENNYKNLWWKTFQINPVLICIKNWDRDSISDEFLTVTELYFWHFFFDIIIVWYCFPIQIDRKNIFLERCGLIIKLSKLIHYWRSIYTWILIQFSYLCVFLRISFKINIQK